jgi:hypothetical protein
MTIRENMGAVQSNNPFLKVCVGYFVGIDGAAPTSVVTAGKNEVTVARSTEGEWTITVNDLCHTILNATCTAFDPDTLIHEVRPTAISGKVVTVRQREAANGTATVAAEDTIARLQFVIWYITDPNVADGV